MTRALHARALLGLAGVTALLGIAPTANATFKQQSDINVLLREYHKYGQFNGSVLVAKHGLRLTSTGYGSANMEWDIANASKTRFRIGSVTKQFTAAVILKLVEADSLKLHVPIRTYLPDYPSENADRITIHHLLTHTSGIPNYTSFHEFLPEDSRDPRDPWELVEYFGERELDFRPGERWSYSNSGYIVLGVIIEAVTGMSYADAVQRYIFTPLKMKDSGYDDTYTLVRQRAAGYQSDPLGFTNAPYLDMTLPYAAGALYSTVEDLYRWDQALIEETILSPESQALMFTPHAPRDPSGQSHYGYGWGMGPMPIGDSGDSAQVVSHTGGINGFASSIARIPSENHLVVLLDNTGSGKLTEITQGIVAILYDRRPARPRESIAHHIGEDIIDDGAEKAIERYRSAREKSASRFDFDEAGMNALGYALFARDSLDDARAIFTLVVEEHPDSWNAHDSLGEIQLAQGDRDLAIESYQHSLTLNPANGNAKRMLRELGVEVPEAPELTVDPAVLDRYAGSYELQPGLVITITRTDEGLAAQITGQPRLPMVATSDTAFSIEAANAQIIFAVTGVGATESLTLVQGGRRMVAPRVE